jgi:hypothetical protein
MPSFSTMNAWMDNCSATVSWSKTAFFSATLTGKKVGCVALHVRAAGGSDVPGMEEKSIERAGLVRASFRVDGTASARTASRLRAYRGLRGGRGCAFRGRRQSVVLAGQRSRRICRTSQPICDRAVPLLFR